jgi:hypothetical protein
MNSHLWYSEPLISGDRVIILAGGDVSGIKDGIGDSAQFNK